MSDRTLLAAMREGILRARPGIDAVDLNFAINNMQRIYDGSVVLSGTDYNAAVQAFYVLHVKADAIWAAEGSTEEKLRQFSDLLGVDVSEQDMHDVTQRAARHRMRAQQPQHPPMPSIDRSGLIKLGRLWHAESFALHDEYHLAITAFLRTMHARVVADPSSPVQQAAYDSFMTHEGQVRVIHLARWVHLGLPTVHYVGHKYAAALMSIRVPRGIDVHPPWETFLIEIPPDLLYAQGKTRLESMAFIFVSRINKPDGMVWAIEGITREGTVLHSNSLVENMQENLDDPAFDADMVDDGSAEFGLTGIDVRTTNLMRRLVLGTCLAMADSTNVQASSKKNPKKNKRAGQLPDEPRIYVVGRPVDMDCREPLRRFMLGETRNPLTVQFMVRGHWRNQACGTDLTGRKVIWIQPYWKGPIDAPVLVRSHVVA